MKKQLVVGEEKFNRLYIDDEELQDKFDYFIRAMRLMGYRLKTSKAETLMKEQINLKFKKLEGGIFDDGLVVEVASCGVRLDTVRFKMYKSGESKHLYYNFDDGLNVLYRLFDKMLSIY